MASIITPYDARDENNNQFPGIYTGVLIANSYVPFFRQVNAHFRRIVAAGIRQVSKSAYFDDLPFELVESLERFTQRIMNRLELNDYNNIVFVWDIDDLTMLPANYFAELEILKPEIDLGALRELQERITSFVGSDDLNVVNIEDAQEYGNLKQFYKDVSGSKTPFNDLLQKLGMMQRKIEMRQTVKQHQQIFHQRWKYSKRCLELVNRRSAKSQNKKYTNVVVSEESLSFALNQLLASGHSSEVEIENVFTTFGVDELSVFNRIRQRFGGEKCFLIHVTSSPGLSDRPFPMWPVRANQAFKVLYKAQKDLFLKET